ncbi:MAG TPA: hypothetical protein PLL02_01135 [Bacteroidales bacterium]|nr:hypothetical protein [Bacteroidales bacterium]
MLWHHWLTIGAFLVCIIALMAHFIRLIYLGKPKDYSRKSGNVTKAVAYSATVAMIDHKESAYLHIPTYFAGMVYHIGTFVSFLLLLFFFINMILQITLPQWVVWVLIAGLSLSALCGFSLLIKRAVSKPMRSLSNADDFISNLLVSLFQLASVAYLLCSCKELSYYLSATILLLYMPVGKLKHLVYFFAARYHLGFFYGWRNVWPPKKPLQ